jgi:hypothetical protein
MARSTTKLPTPAIATRATVAVRDSFDTTGSGVVGDIGRGWDVYDSPVLTAAREASHQRKLKEAEAYFAAQLAK